MRRADAECFKFSNSLSYSMFYDRLLGTVLLKMKNLKNFNHWISEVRALAIEAKVFNEGDEKPMTKKQVYELFNQSNFVGRFMSKMTPKEAFDDEMEAWADAL